MAVAAGRRGLAFVFGISLSLGTNVAAAPELSVFAVVVRKWQETEHTAVVRGRSPLTRMAINQ